MKERKILSVILLTSLTFLLMARYTSSCNQMLCASIVSKCMLTQSCKCDLKNCTCCRDCYQCLSWLWKECCSCVDLCPKPNDTKNSLSKQSHYEQLEGIPGLFNALLEDSDDEKWSAFTFPVDYDTSLFGADSKDSQFYMHSSDIDLQNIKDLNTVTVNCSVSYMSSCMSMSKCREGCASMGASSYRWFFDGCCECIGSTCNRGIDDSRCSECPETKIGDGSSNSLDPLPPNEDDFEYGEDMKNI